MPPTNLVNLGIDLSIVVDSSFVSKKINSIDQSVKCVIYILYRLFILILTREH